MIVICEECGKKYRIDPSKIKGKKAKFKCRACNHVIVASKPEVVSVDSLLETAIDRDVVFEETPEIAVEPKKRKKTRKKPKISGLKRKGISIRYKMIFLFVAIPIILIIIAGYLFLRQLNYFSSEVKVESTQMIKSLAEKDIADKARSVASEVKLYLSSHAYLTKEYFSNDLRFVNIAKQQVGITGYTAVYELPDEDGKWVTWVHENEGIIGIDMKTLAKPLGRNFPGFWKIFTGVEKGKESMGYYTWLEKDGKTLKKKYMACVPVEGTNYVVAATTYLDEFFRPVRNMDRKMKVITDDVKKFAYAILITCVVLIFLVVTLYGHNLTMRIKTLTEIADRISVGELEIDIETKTKDEIGDLGEAISRMQDSIRLSIERLRRRR